MAAFGFWAGYVGAALAVLHHRGELERPLRATSRPELDALLRDGTGPDRALVVGALGRSGRGAVEALATAHESGEVYLERVRGRTTTNPAAQAAIVHVRRVLGETRLDALTPAGTIHPGDGAAPSA